MEDKLN
jgi:hypothetical protein